MKMQSHSGHQVGVFTTPKASLSARAFSCSFLFLSSSSLFAHLSRCTGRLNVRPARPGINTSFNLRLSLVFRLIKQRDCLLIPFRLTFDCRHRPPPCRIIMRLFIGTSATKSFLNLPHWWTTEPCLSFPQGKEQLLVFWTQPHFSVGSFSTFDHQTTWQCPLQFRGKRHVFYTEGICRRFCGSFPAIPVLRRPWCSVWWGSHSSRPNLKRHAVQMTPAFRQADCKRTELLVNV